MSTVQGGQGNIVTNGLVLNLDAANPRSYPQPYNGTTWTDLSGNGNNGTLVNGVAYTGSNGGALVFDGANDHALVGGSTPPSLQGNPSFTVEGWFKRNGSWSGGATWGIGGNASQGGINSYNAGTNLISIDLWGTSTYSTGQTYSLTEWKYIIWTYDGGGFTTSNIIIYINTIPYTGTNLTISRGGSGTPNINTNGIVLARAGASVNLYHSPINISNFRIYSRVLNPSEVLQNFNATRARFGI
jgi:hypothetical protein